MKEILFILLFSLNGSMISAQVISTFFHEKNALETYSMLRQKSHKVIPQKKMLPVSTEKLMKEDKENEKLGDFPFRFGYDFDVNYSLSDGVWEEENEKRIWSLRFSSEKAYSLNFIFSELTLIPGAEIYIFNPDGRMVYGPITEKQNIPQGYDSFLTDLIAGDEVIIQLFEPNTSRDMSKLRISKVIHAYIDMFQTEETLRAASLNCHNDVACYPAWVTESKAVALVLLSSGSYWCSGSLLNNTNQDNRPFFLTAFHCIDRYAPRGSLSTAEINEAKNWSFRFHYKKTTCNGSTTSSYITYNYANFRAAWQATDFALMELLSVDGHANSEISFLGWDRSGNTPVSGTGIHHPAGDLMKISFDNHRLVSNSSVINWSNGLQSPVNTHWNVGYDNGTAEGGSSGSPLFDQNHRVIGQLHGGASGCPPVTKRYGQFHRSWGGGGTNDTRLSNWLDPNNTNVTTLNSIPLCVTINFTNQTVTTNTTITNNCGDINVQNVTVTNGAKLTFEAAGEVNIISDFDVRLGSSFEIK